MPRVKEEIKVSANSSVEEVGNLINCLKNKKIIVRRIKKNSPLIANDNPRHILSMGMLSEATKTFCLPKTETGAYYKVLEKSEQEYLEYVMGLEVNSLSIFKQKDNFWDTRFVQLRKEDNYFDLSNPNQFIDYKILLQNKDLICPSIASYRQQPKATYEFIIVDTKAEMEDKLEIINNKEKAHILYGSIMNDKDKLSYIVSYIFKSKISEETTIDFLRVKAHEAMEQEQKKFVECIEDEYLETKIKIRKGLRNGSISKKGDFFYLKSDNTPLCNSGEDPTILNVCKFLNQPKNQELMFNIENGLK